MLGQRVTHTYPPPPPPGPPPYGRHPGLRGLGQASDVVAVLPGTPDYCTTGQTRCQQGILEICGELGLPHCPVAGWPGPGCPVPWMHTAWYPTGQACEVPTPAPAPPPPPPPWYQQIPTWVWVAGAGAVVLGLLLWGRD